MNRALITDARTRLATLWVFVLVNYLYCDVITNMQAETLKGLLVGNVQGMEISTTFLLAASVLMEIPMAMIVVSALLPYRISRWASVVAGTIMTVVQLGSLTMGSGPTPHYLFFSAVEVGCTVTIVWLAWRWLEAGPEAAAA
jgi:hypothetical protein